jgi:hypothetical protein
MLFEELHVDIIDSSDVEFFEVVLHARFFWHRGQRSC